MLPMVVAAGGTVVTDRRGSILLVDCIPKHTKSNKTNEDCTCTDQNTRAISGFRIHHLQFLSNPHYDDVS